MTLKQNSQYIEIIMKNKLFECSLEAFEEMLALDKLEFEADGANSLESTSHHESIKKQYIESCQDKVIKDAPLTSTALTLCQISPYSYIKSCKSYVSFVGELPSYFNVVVEEKDL
jgi:hypothetical protein